MNGEGSGATMRIAHLTSAHPRYDTRIFIKQCRSLAAAGHRVNLIVADGKGDEMCSGVAIFDVGRPQNRLARMMCTTRRVLAKARALDADVYHLHDPELLPAALVLKIHGKCVIFDAHEDVPLQILGKEYLPPFTRQAVSSSFSALERLACSRLDAVITATPAIRDKFSRIGVEARVVANFPLLEEFVPVGKDETCAAEICYVGSISRIRGIFEVIEAIGLCVTDVRLNLVGALEDKDFKAQLAELPGWKRVKTYGLLSRPEVGRVFARSIAGIVTFLPLPNHIAAQPNKMFEYMSAGLAVIASDFPTWREIVEGAESGICVDPTEPRAIASAIDLIVANREVARRMGINGHRAVRERYSWRQQERELLGIYDGLGNNRGA